MVKNILPEKHLLLTDDKVTIENVGYFRNSECNDFVFFLPKVLLERIEGVNGDRVFAIKGDPQMNNGFAPEEIIDPENITPDGRKLTEEQKQFIYEFAVWIYRSISQFKDNNQESSVVWARKEQQSSAFKRKYVTHTLLDVILALRHFYQENQNYFLFKVNENHFGVNKINWTRTIAKSQAIVQNSTPIYLSPKNKKRVIDFDEELLVIFYSILNYIHTNFGFKFAINFGFNLITGNQFERYLKGYGKKRLQAIKYKYFSDRDLTLWYLCFAFFDKAHKAEVASSGEEYLLAKNFEIIFESIIDDLISNKAVSPLKDLPDGKKIDHLYLDQSLTKNNKKEKTFYIADSKYYKRGNSLGVESIAKQFTYARNLIQLDLDLFLNGEDASKEIKEQRENLEGINLLRDNVTEGYDIIPNFFISARITEDLSYDKDGLTLHNGVREYRNIHFENRLFDRDTLILSHYDVNFLYVIKLYAQNDKNLKAEWRKKVREEFKGHIQALLRDQFSFFAMMPYDEISNEEASKFLKDNFKVTLGKVYSPYPQVNGKVVYSLALENPESMCIDGSLSDEGFNNKKKRILDENESVTSLLKTKFYIVPCELGENPSSKLIDEASVNPIPGAPNVGINESVIVAAGYRTKHIEAVRKSGYCPWCHTSVKNPYTVQMFVFPHTNQADVFYVDNDKGIKGPYTPDEVKSKYLEFSDVELPFEKYYVWPVTETPS